MTVNKSNKCSSLFRHQKRHDILWPHFLSWDLVILVTLFLVPLLRAKLNFC